MSSAERCAESMLFRAALSSGLHLLDLLPHLRCFCILSKSNPHSFNGTDWPSKLTLLFLLYLPPAYGYLGTKKRFMNPMSNLDISLQFRAVACFLSGLIWRLIMFSFFWSDLASPL